MNPANGDRTLEIIGQLNVGILADLRTRRVALFLNAYIVVSLAAWLTYCRNRDVNSNTKTAKFYRNVGRAA